MPKNILSIADNSKKIFIYLFIATYFIGVWVFLLQDYSLINAFYTCLQLIVLNVSFDPQEIPIWQLNISRFLLPLFTIITIVLVFLNFFMKKYCI
jgi:hypothetical protein